MDEELELLSLSIHASQLGEGAGDSGADEDKNKEKDKNKPCPPIVIEEGIKSRFPPTILNENGSNFGTWKALIPVTLQTEPYAWEVVDSQLQPNHGNTEEAIKQQQNYLRGNRAGRYILLNSIDKELVRNLFAEDSAAVSAPVVWRGLRDHFVQGGATQKFIATNNFMAFQFKEDLSVYENISNFKRLKYALDQAGAELKEDMVCLVAHTGMKLFVAMSFWVAPLCAGWSFSLFRIAGAETVGDFLSLSKFWRLLLTRRLDLRSPPSRSVK